jgi:hypothetical protein
MSIIRQLARVANRIDSASTGTFLSKGDSTGDFTTVNYTDLSGRPTTLDSAALTTIVDSAYIQARQTGGGAAGLDSAAITALVDSNYVVARSPSASSGFAQYEYTATAGQTTFQDSDINGNVMSYTADGIFVFYNGVLIAPTTDYEATDGSSVVLTTGADSGSHVAISKWSIAGGGSGGGFALGGDRALVMGGGLNTNNQISYYSITTSATAQDFGDCTTAQAWCAATSDGTTGIWTGSSSTINYVTISSPGNATDFGDNNGGHGTYYAGLGDGTYAVWGGGYSGGSLNPMSYVTIATPSNTSDFGDLHTRSERLAGTCGDQTYGLWVGGYHSGFLNNIQYITVATPANASDFGDLTVARQQLESVANDTYAITMGGVIDGWGYTNVIDYFAIATPGNASDFGDVTGGTAGWPAGSTDGTYGSFHLGLLNGSATTDVHNVTIDTPGNSTDHCDLLSSTYYGLGACSGSPS